LATVQLICAQKPCKGEEWTLTATQDGLVLTDHDGEVVTLVPNAQTPLRIKFPSFWASISFLIVVDETGGMHCFQPKKETVAAVRQRVAQCQGQAGSAAVTTVQNTAVRDLLIGLCLFALGALLTVGSLLLSQPGGYYIVTTGLLGVGLAGIIKGLYGFYKASQIQRSLPDEEEIEEAAEE